MVSNLTDNIADELAQGSITHASRPSQVMPIKDNFLPWHKPRKHWVRRYQWGLESKRLIEELELSNKRALRYMTLPGPDMLDVRFLHTVCQDMNTKLSFIGYIHADQNDLLELELSESEVRDMQYLDSGTSRVVQDDFQTLADPSSVGSSAVINGASFDVINIDLCKCVGEFEPEDKQRSYFDSIRQLFTLQVKKRVVDEPWLFFITTRADFDRVCPKSRQGFFQLLIDACTKSGSLLGSLKNHFGVTMNDLIACRDGKMSKTFPFEKIFAIALGEWIAHVLDNFAPKVRVQLLDSSRAYGVKNPSDYDMLSLAFRCETVFHDTTDHSGLSGEKGAVAPVQYDQFLSVSQMVSAIADIKNLDSVFASYGLYNNLTEQAAQFMGSARFNEDKYRDWAWRRPEAAQAREEREQKLSA